MAVVITWSLTDGGAAISDPLDHGTDAAGVTLTEQEIYLRHDGANPIIGCKFYLAEKSGIYSGSASPSDDLAEILSWGDGLAAGGPAEASEFGGFQFNMDAINAYAASWPTFGLEGGVGDVAVVCRTGIGDNTDNGIVLHTSMGLASSGTIQTGSTPNIRFKMRIQLPADESVTGDREVDQKLRFTFTS